MPYVKPPPLWQAGAPLTRGCVGYYLLHERAFGTPAVRNLVPGGTGGATIVSAPTWTSGPYGPAVATGNTAGAVPTNVLRLGNLGTFAAGTLAVLCTADAFPAGANAGSPGLVVSHINAASARIYLGANNNAAGLYRLGGGSLLTGGTNGVVVAGRACVLAMTWSGTTLDGYVDGVKQVSAGAFSGTPGSTASPVEVGGQTGAASSWNGSVHVVALWDHRKPDAEIQAITGDFLNGSFLAVRSPRRVHLFLPAPTDITATAGKASTLVVGTPVATLSVTATAGKASTLTVGTPTATLTVTATAGIASGLVVGTPTATLSVTATAGVASTLVVGTPTADLAVDATAGIASTLVVGTPDATLAVTATAGIGSTLVVGMPAAAVGNDAVAGIPSGLVVGTPTASTTVTATAGTASTLTVGDPTATLSITATAGIASTLVVGDPTATVAAPGAALDTGVYTVTGHDAGLSVVRVLRPRTGVYTITGRDVAGPPGPSVGPYTFASQWEVTDPAGFASTWMPL